MLEPKTCDGCGQYKCICDKMDEAIKQVQKIKPVPPPPKEIRIKDLPKKEN